MALRRGGAGASDAAERGEVDVWLDACHAVRGLARRDPRRLDAIARYTLARVDNESPVSKHLLLVLVGEIDDE